MRLLTHPFRLSRRLTWLTAELILAGLGYIPMVALRRAECRVRARTLWLQRHCRRVLHVLHVGVNLHGKVPTSGLLVSNHLSYLDVLVLSALAPAVFVAKREVKRWPILGWLATLAGTVFVDRRKRMQTLTASRQMKSILDRGVTLVLFPEGTSSDGKSVLPFRSSLFEPVAKGTHTLVACLIQYELHDGDVGEEVCYWKNMTFIPHLLNLLTKERILARLALSRVERLSKCRKETALQLHCEVTRLNELYRRHTGPGLREELPGGTASDILCASEVWADSLFLR